MLRQDSIHAEPIVSSATADTIQQKPAKPQTPYQVLRLLPKDATPAQQDSAIQAWFQPGEIHYSSRPDGGRFGVAGDPIPYTIKNDNIITSMLLVCFVMTLIAFSFSRSFLLRQAKNFFYIPKSEAITETSTEIKSQLFFLLQTCLLLALLYFFYTRKYIANTFILSDEYLLVAILTGVFICYFILKGLIYTYVNTVFFDNKRKRK